MTNRLTSKQKWQLAIRLLLLYAPLLLYVNLPEAARTADTLLDGLPYFLGFSVVALGMYFIWINATDLIQRQLFRWFGEEFLLEFNWLALLLAVLVSLGLAMLYILAFRVVLQGIFTVIHYIQPFTGPKPDPSTLPAEALAYVQRANNGFSVVIMLSAFYLTINARAYLQLKNVQLKAERLEKEAALSQFEALKNQLSPHFLFNSLSILTSLIHEDVDLSEQFIKHLSKAYRYILEQRDQNLVLLKTELEFIQAYTFLLQIRFENKFQVSVDVPQEVQQQYRIAPLSLQMLVENAVKHNRMSVREPLQVRIYSQGEELVIDNRIQPRDQPEFSTGVGLRNITNRYALLSDRRVEYGAQAGNFMVKIPLIV
ncbi:sensor histidine kinase YesM [Spirosoma lacussanchae]|uniref:sensor histidine kinase n=1 Tax=Spirosoma lacussanchae TaxID=1884249 RepID=UPI001108F599|nr:histidine kinase [Spirosoma lacussanchae]